ncbi:MAG: hypothetical protein EBV42_03185 [Actinobacteria bacterium]|nr:hypothetical protein [Actinomycetota bacterium]
MSSLRSLASRNRTAPLRHDDRFPMQTTHNDLNATEFATVARVLAQAAVALDLVAPGFRTPPRIVGVDRTLRRFMAPHADSAAPHSAFAPRDGGVVSVVIKGRPLAAVVADMIEGVVVLNQLSPAASAHARAVLWRALDAARTARDVA